MKLRLISSLPHYYLRCTSQFGILPNRLVNRPRLASWLNPSTIVPGRSLKNKTGKDFQMGDYISAPPQEEAPFPLTDTDKWILSLTDEEYPYHTWDGLKTIIENNDLAQLKRKPSDLRRYMEWTAGTKAAYGNITNYLLAHRLPSVWGRPPFAPVSATPFADPSDYRVLPNDWPYGFVPGIVHIVVWSRTLIPTDPKTGDMTVEARRTVGEFVKRYFVDPLGPGGEDKVLWFKNWVALQSVRALEHVHVLVRDVDPKFLEEWTREREWHRSSS